MKTEKWTFNLPKMTNEFKKELLDYSRISKVDLNAVVERAIKYALAAAKEGWDDGDDCPSCHVERKESRTLKTMPLKLAITRGLVHDNKALPTGFINNTLFVTCPFCGFYGFPHKK